MGQIHNKLEDRVKIVTKKEWAKTPKECKGEFHHTPYMIYREPDGSTCLGPVKIMGKDSIMNFREIKGTMKKVIFKHLRV